MKKIFFDAIRTGQKTATLRYWKGPRVRTGSMHLVPGLGMVRIDAVVPIKLGGLRRRDALADGFDSLAKLRKTLTELYPPAKQKGRELYQVSFTFVGK